jgi:hypothetical protein
MRRSVPVAAAVLALLLPAAPALAQSSPFAPLPQPAQTAAPAPTAGGPTDTGSRTLLLIGAALLVAFVAIGVWIARDARRSVPQHHHARGARAMAEPERGEPRERRKPDRRAKEQARKRTRAQKRARRHNRPGR